MAASSPDCEGELAEELRLFLHDFDKLLNKIDSSSDNLHLEYLERKLENYLTVLLGLICQMEGPTEDESDVHKLLKQLFDHSYGKWENIFQKTLEKELKTDQGFKYFAPNTKSETRGRLKFLVTKEQLPTLRETGMEWSKIAFLFGHLLLFIKIVCKLIFGSA